ncbi:MAG TPA: aminotransferase class V-fold PLP-dependent enzyme [Acidimicrobiales bacterium]
MDAGDTRDTRDAGGGLGVQREAFAVPDGVAYFNTASLAPLLHRVLEAGHAALRRRAEPWAIRADDWFDDVERLRALAAPLFGPTADAEGVALVPASSYGMAVAAANLVDAVDPATGGRDGVLVLAGEYPSGVYTWRRFAAETGARLVTVDREPGQSWTDAVLAALAADGRIGLVSAPTVHWTDGARVDLAAVSAGVREAGARLVVDASQSLGAVPFDVDAVRPDVVVAVGYKWALGPVGRSYLWVAERLRDGRPLEENWIVRRGARDFAGLVDYGDAYAPGARRYDQGQRTLFEVTPMAIAALEQVHAWGVDRIAAALAGVTGTIVDRLGRLGLAPSVPTGERSPHILGVPLPAPARAGVLAALERADCHAAVRGPMLRVSPHLHVTPADVDRLVDALASAV